MALLHQPIDITSAGLTCQPNLLDELRSPGNGQFSHPGNLPYQPLTQATSAYWLEPQMLIILDQVTHGVMHVTPRAQVTPVDQANPQPVLMFIFFEVAVVEAALTTGDAPPKLSDPLCPVDVGTHFSAVEEESSMDVIPTILALFNAADIAGFMIENQVPFTLSNQPVQVVEYVLHTQPSLGLSSVIQINPDHAGTGVAIKHGINVAANLDLLLNRLVALVVLPTLESLLGEKRSDALGQLVQRLTDAQIARFTLVQAGYAKGAALNPNGLAGFLKKAQLPAALILRITIE